MAAPRLVILMATYQGQPHLPAQLDSIAALDGTHWRLVVSDDGSTDGTEAILAAFAARQATGRVTLVSGPRRGALENFLSLIARDDEGGEVYAFADQDDVWERDKITRAWAWLASVPAATPALYCSRTRIIDETGRHTGLSPLFRRPPSFANALTQNLASGNTMVFNAAARRLLRQTIAGARLSVMHDWWAYLIVTGAGGAVRYDPTPTVCYRQHATNEVGTRIGTLDRVANVPAMLTGRWRRWTDKNLEALEATRDTLTPDATRTLDTFSAARRQALVPRLAGLRQSGVYRQTRRGTVLLWAAACAGRL